MATDRRDRNPANGTPTTDDEHADHLERSRTVWDRWSDWYETSERDLEPMREAAIDRLDLRAGDRVLEIGCGPGVNFERIRRDIGPEGELVAIDYSPKMVEKARERVETHGWENVEVRRADATTAEFDEPFDAALATLSLSVMPDVRRATESVYRSLRPDATFVVFDIRTVPEGPARILNPLLWRFLRWYANWNPDDDVEDALETVFEEGDVPEGRRNEDGDAVEIVDTYMVGTTYTIVCEKRDVA